MNDLKLIGRLTKDPDAPTEYQGGAKKLIFSIAVRRDFKAKDGADADFFNLTAWNKSAEIISKYLRKGSMVAVTARLQSSTYKDKDGNNKYRLDIIADRVEFLDTRSSDHGSVPGQANTSGQPGDQPADNKTPAGFEQQFMQVDDSDLPF